MIPVERVGGALIVGGQTLTPDEADQLAATIRTQVEAVRRDAARAECEPTGPASPTN